MIGEVSFFLMEIYLLRYFVEIFYYSIYFFVTISGQLRVGRWIVLNVL